MSIKNILTPAGIEPATFQFVAQHLNHCATAVPRSNTFRRTYEYVRLFVACNMHLSGVFLAHLHPSVNG